MPPINRVSEFIDLGLEHRFREENVERTRRINYLIAILVVAACILFAVNDIQHGDTSVTIVGTRLLLAIAIIAITVVNGRLKRWQEVFAITYTMTALVMLTAGWIDYRRPPDFLTHVLRRDLIEEYQPDLFEVGQGTAYRITAGDHCPFNNAVRLG